MNNVIETLYEALTPDGQSPAEKAAIKAAENAVRQAEAKLTRQEFDSLWNALMDIGHADELDWFARGLRLGMRLMLEGVCGGEL